ncbi:hypothetical protein AHAS_Ahas20G0262000 [Arachis hypogaea]
MEDIHEEKVVVEAPHEEEEIDKRHDEEGVSLKEPKRKAIVDESIPIPFPSLVKKAKKTPEFDLNILQVFKKVEVIIPLLDAIQQIPKNVVTLDLVWCLVVLVDTLFMIVCVI